MTPFFTLAELQDFHNVRQHPYRKGNQDDAVIDARLRQGVWSKTEIWLNAVLGELPGFAGKIMNRRTQPGGRNQPAKFKPYTWATIYKLGDQDKCIYFTVGVDADGQCLIAKIDYQINIPRSQNGASLTEKQRDTCKNLIRPGDSPEAPSQYSLVFADTQIDELTQEELVRQTVQFIRQHEPDYALFMALIWPKQAALPAISVQVPDQAFEPGAGPAFNDVAARAYIVPERTVQPELVHQRISQMLYEHLTSEFGQGAIAREYATPVGTYIDMVKHLTGNSTYYEIKTYQDIRQCVREAVGQLLEYAYWPGNRPAQELVIVTPHPVTPAVADYMVRLRATLNVSIWYQQFEVSTRILVDRV